MRGVKALNCSLVAGRRSGSMDSETRNQCLDLANFRLGRPVLSREVDEIALNDFLVILAKEVFSVTRYRYLCLGYQSLAVGMHGEPVAAMESSHEVELGVWPRFVSFGEVAIALEDEQAPVAEIEYVTDRVDSIFNDRDDSAGLDRLDPHLTVFQRTVKIVGRPSAELLSLVLMSSGTCHVHQKTMKEVDPYNQRPEAEYLAEPPFR